MKPYKLNLSFLENIFLLIVLQCLSSISHSQQIISLYNDTIPNATSYKLEEDIIGTASDPIAYQHTSSPTITAYFPEKDKRNGTAVIIFPGGAYSFLAFKEEGTKITQPFVDNGICVFVVKYRLPDGLIMKNRSIGPLQDAQQAIKLVRIRAEQWNLDTGRIGIMGFSAGGHLAATAATHFNHNYIPNPEKVSLRPSFLILVYPVISMADSLTHKGSRDRLLSLNPSKEQIALFSNELQVSDSTPPTWLIHASDDRLVPVENSIIFYQALKRHHIPVEMHLHAKGDHGFVLQRPVIEWTRPIFSWMKEMGWL